jgi:hypothetical protein
MHLAQISPMAFDALHNLRKNAIGKGRAAAENWRSPPRDG